MKNWQTPTIHTFTSSNVKSGNPADVFPCEMSVTGCATLTCYTPGQSTNGPFTTGQNSTCLSCFPNGTVQSACS